MRELVEFIIKLLDALNPTYFIYEYQRGCRFWCGRYISELEPGLHWKVPYFHTMMRENVVDTTMLLPAQSIITKDDKEVIIRGSVGYKIVNIPKFFCSVYDTKSALGDNAMIIIRGITSETDYELLKDIGLESLLTTALQQQVEKYGIQVNFLTFTDISKGRSFRLFNENISLIS